MTYPFLPQDPAAIDYWSRREPGRSLLTLQKRLLEGLWSPPQPHRVLQIGGANASFLEWFTAGGHQVTALEPSLRVREWLRTRLPPRVDLAQGGADDLPYNDNDFDTVAIIHALESATDPRRIIGEAGRVARRHVLLLTCNPYSISGCYQAVKSWWRLRDGQRPSQYSLFGVKRLLGETCYGGCSVSWASGPILPVWTIRYLGQWEGCRWLRHHPFGHYLALRIDLHYTFRALQDPLLQKSPGTPKPVHLRTSLLEHARRRENSPPRIPHAIMNPSAANGFLVDGNQRAVP